MVPPFCAIHCLASVVFPYPAGATSRIVRALVCSSWSSSLGRSMIRRTGGVFVSFFTLVLPERVFAEMGFPDRKSFRAAAGREG